MKRLLTSLFLVTCFLAPIAHGQKAVKEWLFKHKTTQITKALQKGRPITVKWQGISGRKTSTGILLNISADSTLLDIKRKIVNIPNDRITDIQVKSKANVFVSMLAGVLIYISIFILGAILLTLAATGRGGDGIPTSYLALGGASLLLGILILVNQSKAIKLHDPFGPEWSFQEVSPPPKNKAP